MKISLGIDLGTTYSCAAYVNEDGKAVVIKNSEGNLTTPSVVLFPEDEGQTVVVGENAKENSKIYPERCCSYIKRNIGKKEGFYLNGENISPEEISSYILLKIVKDAKETLLAENIIKEDEDIKDVVITCPAYFGINEREATKTAGEIAGLNVLNIINEPTAAAISYSLSENEDYKKVMVYDFGGGTFDITIVSINKDTIEVIATAGDHNLGGKDLDSEILMNIDYEFKQENGKSIFEDMEAISEIQLSVEKLKKKLSKSQKVSIPIRTKDGSLKYTLTRDKYEELIEPLIERSLALVKDSLEMSKAKTGSDKIDEIILVGGTTKTPIISEKLKNINPNIKIFDPDESVAKGAAIFAYKMKNKEKIIKDLNANGLDEQKVKEKIEKQGIESVAKELNIEKDDLKFLASDKKIKNISSRTFGVVGLNKNMEEKLFNIVMRNDSLPACAKDNFNLVEEGQEELNIKILESITMNKIDNVDVGNKIGELLLKVPEGTKITDNIVVEFKLEENGLLKVKATINNKDAEIELDTKDLINSSEKKDAMMRVKNTNLE